MKKYLWPAVGAAFAAAVFVAIPPQRAFAGAGCRETSGTIGAVDYDIRQTPDV